VEIKAYYYIYGFIQYYKTMQFVFCDKLSYCTAKFHIEDQFNGGRNPDKILKY